MTSISFMQSLTLKYVHHTGTVDCIWMGLLLNLLFCSIDLYIYLYVNTVFYYYGLVMYSEIKKYYTPAFFFLKIALMGLVLFPHKSQNCLFNSTKKKMPLEFYEGCSLFTCKKQNLTLAISISSQPIYLSCSLVHWDGRNSSELVELKGAVSEPTTTSWHSRPEALHWTSWFYVAKKEILKDILPSTWAYSASNAYIHAYISVSIRLERELSSYTHAR